ncbi:MAG: glutathione synthase [Gammaproteobacteria bacterium]
MTVQLGIVMDPIGSIKIGKDSSFAMLLAAQARGWALHYMEMDDLYLSDGVAWARQRPLEVRDEPGNWFSLGEPHDRPLADLNVILMRKDPPVDDEFVYATHILERAESTGTIVVNRAASLRDWNEKLATARFPQCCVPTLVSRDPARLRGFLDQHPDSVMKPLNAMGGAEVFHVRKGDLNTSVIIETLTRHGQRQIMAQRFIPEISEGDKRILLVDGEAIPYALARIPAEGEGRGNLAAGGRGEGVPLSDRDLWISAQVGPALRASGLRFVGIDVIGDYLTEINVTSPTCIRELDALYDLDIAGDLMDSIATSLNEAL